MKIDVFSIRLSLTEKESDWIKCDTKNYKMTDKTQISYDFSQYRANTRTLTDTKH